MGGQEAPVWGEQLWSCWSRTKKWCWRAWAGGATVETEVGIFDDYIGSKIERTVTLAVWGKRKNSLRARTEFPVLHNWMVDGDVNPHKENIGRAPGLTGRPWVQLWICWMWGIYETSHWRGQKYHWIKKNLELRVGDINLIQLGDNWSHEHTQNSMGKDTIPERSWTGQVKLQNEINNNSCFTDLQSGLNGITYVKANGKLQAPTMLVTAINIVFHKRHSNGIRTQVFTSLTN